jgi:hypothetical protein
VWTEKAGKLIGFELDHGDDDVLMMNAEDQKSLSDGLGTNRTHRCDKLKMTESISDF